MKRVHLIPVLALGLLPLAAGAADFNPEAWKVRESRMVTREATVSAGGQDVRIVVYTEPERQAWGRKLAEWATRLVPAMVQRFGDLPEGNEVRIIEEPDLPSFGWNGLDHGVRLRYPADIYELSQQLVHYWINPFTVKNYWLQKGIAGWEGILAMRRADLPMAAEAYFQRTLHRAKSQWTDRDFPLATVDLRTESAERFRFGRAKATVFLALLHTAMGDRGYTEWVQGLAERSSPYDLDDLKATLKDAGRNPETMLSGWVEGGGYGAYRWADLADSDRDGVPNAMESLLGTDPEMADSDRDRLSDGFEYWHMLNPADRDTMGDNTMDAERVGMAVDGLPADWRSRELKPAFADGSGESPRFDLGEVYVAADAGHLFLRLDPVQPVEPELDYWMSVYLDTDGDRKPDVVAAADQAEQTWVVRFRRGAQTPEAGEPHLGLRMRYAQVVEWAIPLELLEGKTEFAFTVRVDEPQGAEAMDNLGGYWHQVDLSKIGVR